jgi:hypothetical protein
MISADEARKQQYELNTEKEKRQLAEVEELIMKDIKKGYTYLNGSLCNAVLRQLKDLGYKTEYSSGDQREGSYTKITW